MLLMGWNDQSLARSLSATRFKTMNFSSFPFQSFAHLKQVLYIPSNPRKNNWNVIVMFKVAKTSASLVHRPFPSSATIWVHVMFSWIQVQSKTRLFVASWNEPIRKSLSTITTLVLWTKASKSQRHAKTNMNGLFPRTHCCYKMQEFTVLRIVIAK